MTQAIRLMRLFKRQYPDEKPAEHWARMYRAVILSYADMNPMKEKAARERLRERVRWRRRKTRNALIKA